MSKEQFMPTSGEFRVAAAITAGILLGVATPTETYEPKESAVVADLTASPRTDHRRCYDEPQPSDRVGKKAQKPIELNKDTHGQIEGQPLKKINPSITEKLRGATVRVENGAGMGTGYIAESDKDGSTIVTAAHVIYNPTITESEQGLRYLSVQDYKGNKSKVVSGCYMEENNGVFKSLSRGEFQPTDIAILRVSPPLGSATLKLAGSEPERGSWDPYFYNFQGRRKVNEPATYSGMVIANADSRNGYEVLTGITSFRNCEPKRLYNSMVSPCAAEGGSSGGPVVDRDTGNVIGISVASLITESKGYSAEDLLKTSGSVDPQFDVGLGTGSWPIISILVPTETIQTALESSTYRLIDYK